MTQEMPILAMIFSSPASRAFRYFASPSAGEISGAAPFLCSTRPAPDAVASARYGCTAVAPTVMKHATAWAEERVAQLFIGCIRRVEHGRLFEHPRELSGSEDGGVKLQKIRVRRNGGVMLA